jgi:predicted branched-subunit amino acid permease
MQALQERAGMGEGSGAEAAGSFGRAFAQGLKAAHSVPAAVLFATALGFGALARDGGFSIGHTAFMSLTMFALPNQVVLVDQLARSEGAAVAALAVALAAMRLFPMTATIVPLFRGSRRRRWLELIAAHFVAITTWIEAIRRLPGLPADARLPYQLGLGAAISAVMLAGALAGYALAGSVPAVLAAALLFLTPLYFLLSLIATSRSRTDLVAIAAGCALAPVFFVLAPGIDLLATGIAGGTLAFLLGRARRPGGGGGAQ